MCRSPGHISCPAHYFVHCRPVKYKSWTDDHVSKAIDAVHKENLSVRRAALEFDVPKSTLHDRLIGRVVLGGQSGPQKYLTDEEEDELEEFLVGCASVGFARSRQQVIELVQEVVNRKGRTSESAMGGGSLSDADTPTSLCTQPHPCPMPGWLVVILVS